MNFKKFIVLFLIIFVLLISIGTISATDNINNQTISADDVYEPTNENLLTSSKTIIVPFDPKNPNEVLLPKIQPAIDSANSGDTVIIEGSPVHCHLVINKTLNIIADEYSTIDPCPHHTHQGLDEHGVFYITEGGSGSVIQGFSFINKDKAETPFAILIDGASDVTIKDCTINDPTLNVDKYVGIIIKNSHNIKLSNLLINNTIYGITIINSSNIYINDCLFSNAENYAIAVTDDSNNIYIQNNSILRNKNSAINLSCANNVFILNNLIKNNGYRNSDTGSGIYVNTNITKLVVKGNIFQANGLHAIMYDYRCRNLNNEEGADQLTIVDDNYFEGHSSMILHHRTYVKNSQGNMVYDAENDVFTQSGNGEYIESKSYVYMQNAFIYKDMPCGFTYYTTSIPWTLDAPANNGEYNLSLTLSEIVEIKKGVYQIAIVDSDGKIATDFNSGYFIFYLNDCTTVIPRDGNVYKNVSIQNGVATADFRDVYTLYDVSNNKITAVFPGLSSNINSNPYKQLLVADSDIPINPSTTLVSSQIVTYPISDSYISARLLDSNNNPVAGEIVIFSFNNKVFKAITDNNGIAQVKFSLTSKKTYSVSVSYFGGDDYKASYTSTKITVKTGSKKSKITSSNIKMKKNKMKSFKFKLLSSAKKAISKQKIIVKVNNKHYTVKTNKKGIGKVSLKFKKAKKYKIVMKFLGNLNYKASLKTSIITVK